MIAIALTGALLTIAGRVPKTALKLSVSWIEVADKKRRCYEEEYDGNTKSLAHVLASIPWRVG